MYAVIRLTPTFNIWFAFAGNHVSVIETFPVLADARYEASRLTGEYECDAGWNDNDKFDVREMLPDGSLRRLPAPVEFDDGSNDIPF
jgi:hypothetical protein